MVLIAKVPSMNHSSTDNRPRLLVVGGDSSREAAVRAARGCQFAGQIRDWSEARRLPRAFDALVIATPIGERPNVVRAALDAGKHVLCDAPLSKHDEEARELARLADDRGLRLTTAFPRRFDPPVREALDLIRSWAIGRVRGLRVEIGRADVGEILDAFDLIRSFLGEVVSALFQEAFVLFRNSNRDVAEVRTEGDCHSTYDILGSDGYLRVESAPWRLSGRLADGKRLRKRYRLIRAAEVWRQRRCLGNLSCVRQIQAFAAPPTPTQAPVAASGWDGCRAQEMVSALERSKAVDGEVALRPLPVRVRKTRLWSSARRLD
jgi:predicted dehydrogenase